MGVCQICGVEAPTKYVEFSQNIGALFMRFSTSIKGNLCKYCINHYFWSFTGTTLVYGWWGVISFFVTPFFLLNNIQGLTEIVADRHSVLSGLNMRHFASNCPEFCASDSVPVAARTSPRAGLQTP
jgi:hypothetical protein